MTLMNFSNEVDSGEMLIDDKRLEVVEKELPFIACQCMTTAEHYNINLEYLAY